MIVLKMTKRLKEDSKVMLPYTMHVLCTPKFQSDHSLGIPSTPTVVTCSYSMRFLWILLVVLI